MSTESAVDPRTDCTADADGRITFRLRLPSPTRARLLLARRHAKGRPEQESRTLTLEPAGSDGEVRAVLEPAPPLAEGRWDVYLLRGPDAERERLRPGLRDVRALVDGGLRDRPSPLAVRVPYATTDGFLAVRAWLRTAHPEASRVDIADGTMTVHARLHGAVLSEGAAGVLRLRGDKDTVRGFPVRRAGGGFSFTVAFGELVAEDGGARVWGVFLRPAADAPLIRVCRLLDDLADRKGVFVYPRVTVGGSVLRPHYTVDNDLAVEVTAGG
ncbi:transferase [Streptomyces marokkonensis]|uniref:transferase n=1 Tax=Streptomyces marokkonensis TaxID=324855 RepID=UPI0011F0AAEA|nr:transferase [Streptomyces marokkonensis]